MKIPITRAHARIRGSFYEEGSVLRRTATSGCEDISLELVRKAERMCYMSEIVTNPVGTRLAVKLNGASIAVSDSET